VEHDVGGLQGAQAAQGDQVGIAGPGPDEPDVAGSGLVRGG
jgi:hypothetical protein